MKVFYKKKLVNQEIFPLFFCLVMMTVYSGVVQGKACCAIGNKSEGLKAIGCYQLLHDEESCKDKAKALVGGDISGQHYRWFENNKCTDLEFGGKKLCPLPLAVQLLSFSARQVESGIELSWDTSEILLAVNVWRAQQNEEDGYFDITKLNDEVIYGDTFVDETAQAGIEFFYGLETINHEGVADLDVGSVISAIRN